MIDGAGIRTVGADVRMSKKELIDEMKKEKQQHHRQIRYQHNLHYIYKYFF